MLQVGVAVALASVAGLMLYQARVSAWNAAAQQAVNLATALQRDIEKNIEVIDRTLQSAADGTLLLEHTHAAQSLQHAILFDGADPTADAGAVLIIDEHGAATFDSVSAAPRERDFSSQPYFQYHSAHPDRALRLTLLPSALLTGQPALLLTRRIDHADGSFAGVAAESLRLSLFKNLFGSLHLAAQDDVVVTTADGQDVFSRTRGKLSFAKDVSHSRFYKASQGADATITQAISPEDGVARLYAQRRLKNAPLTVSVGLALDGIYASWRHQAWIVGGLLALLLVGAVLLALGLRRELQRRERAEASLKASEATYRLLSDHASDMICRIGADGQARYVSPAAERLLGMPAEALLGTLRWDYAWAEDRPHVEQVLGQLAIGAVDVAQVTFRARRSDGEWRWMEVVGRAYRDPVSQQPDGYVSAWRDVTDRMRAEALLSDSEARYRLLADNAIDLITCIDLDFRRTYASPASKAVLGYAPEEMLGVTPSSVLHPDDAATTNELLQRLAAGELEGGTLTNRISHKDGHYVWVEANVSLLRGTSGEPLSIMCVMRDITVRKAQADQLVAVNHKLEDLTHELGEARDVAEQASRAKSRFLATMSHELRTPLSGVLGYAELLHAEGDLSARQVARVEAMLSAGRHLLDMVNSVLDLSAIESGHIELRLGPVELSDVLDQSLQLVRPAAERKGLMVTSGIDASLPETILADPGRMRQILVNLLGNAVKFTASGRVDLRALRTRDDRLRLEVADTGPGVPAALRDRLFQDFGRLSTDVPAEGTGLGLALSSRLAEAMDGTMGYDPNPGGGSLFWCELPIVAASSTAEAHVPDPASQAGFPALELLIVDDMAENRDIASSFLTMAGHRTTCASSGQEAVRLAAATDFDVMLMDVRMPGMDGLEATRQIRALPGPRGCVPIVALTAQSFAEDLLECERAGMTDRLTKPFNQATLLAVVSRAAAAGSPIADPARSQPSRAPLFGDDLAIMHLATFEQTRQVLPPAKCIKHVQSLAERTDALIAGLEATGAGTAAFDVAGSQPLVFAAHALAGSVGMYGFHRLSAVCGRFEHEAAANVAALPGLAANLLLTARLSLLAMQDVLPGLQEGAPGIPRSMAEAGLGSS